MARCTVQLLDLSSDTSVSKFYGSLDTSTRETVLIRGKPHGWVQKPRKLNREQLESGHKTNQNDWDLFLLTTTPIATEILSRHSQVLEHLYIPISIPQSQFDSLLSRIKSNAKPVPCPETPPLPAQWFLSSGRGTIPPSQIVPTRLEPLKSGELVLDQPMADFLSAALPSSIANEPLCYFNLFKYLNGDRTVHDAYMDGFKENFGSAAGAEVLFMGPVEGSIQVDGQVQVGRWDDANLVQYDTVWHYAYMLSTKIYQKLNKQKMAGLEDTCIMLVSEIELTDL